MNEENINLVLPNPVGFPDFSDPAPPIDSAPEHVGDAMEESDYSPFKPYRGSFSRIIKSTKLKSASSNSTSSASSDITTISSTLTTLDSTSTSLVLPSKLKSSKTAVRISETVSPSSKRKYEVAFGKHIENISPVKTTGSPNPVKGRSPLSVVTASGKKLNLRLEFPEYSLYDDTAIRHNELQGDKLKDFLAALFEGVTEIEKLTKKSADLTEKKQVVVMTQNKREEYAKKARINGKKKRTPEQKKAMAELSSGAISATEIVEKYFQPDKIIAAADKLKLSESEKESLLKQFGAMSAEWLHLIDFANLGNEAQTSDNLVFGTEEANSQMIIIEELIKRELKKGKTVTIEVTAKMFKFHIPYEIQVIVSYDGITKSYAINPLTRQKPITAEVDCEEVLHKAKKRRLEEKAAAKKAAEAKSIDIEAFKSDSSDLFGSLVGFSATSSSFFSSSSSSSSSTTTTTSTTTCASASSSLSATSSMDIVMGEETKKHQGLGPEPGAVGSSFSSLT